MMMMMMMMMIDDDDDDDVSVFFWLDLVGGDWNITFIFPYIGTNHPN